MAKQWSDLTPKEKRSGIIGLVVIAIGVWAAIAAMFDGGDDYPYIEDEEIVTPQNTIPVDDDAMEVHHQVREHFDDALVHGHECREIACDLHVDRGEWHQLPHEDREMLFSYLVLFHLEDEDVTSMNVLSHTDREELSSYSLDTGRMH